ncbi:DUF2577 family protein [Anaerosporobacter sp.]
MNDKGYEKLIVAIKQLCASKNNILLGVMLSSNSCKINELQLDRDDLYIAEHLTTGYLRFNEDTYTNVEKLKLGDLVLVCKISDEKYAIIERLVEV